MEASIFTSNCFTKTTELVPSIKSIYPACSRKKSSQFQTRRECISSSVTCSHLGSSSYSMDDKRPVIKTDWRAFRARLVAAERAATSRSASDPSSSAVDLDKAMNYVPQIILGEKWAHEIYEPEKGCLLIATEKLDGVHIFERTVILVISTGPAGPFGIILNKPSLMSIKETKSTVLDLDGTFFNRPLFFGGPLDEGIFLVNTKGNDVNGVGKSGIFEPVMEDLYFGTKESVGCAAEMVKRNMVDVGDIKFFDGYCGWDNEQIRGEIIAGFWRVAACNARVVESASIRGNRLWEDILGLMGCKKVAQE